MRVEHPLAGDGPGTPPAAVDVNGETVRLDDDGTFAVDDGGWLQTFARVYDCDAEALVVSGDDEAADAEADDADSANDEASDAEDAPFGVEAFVDRTPVSDVAADIRDGEVDDVLDAVADAEEANRDRKTVHEAIDARRNELE